MLYLPPGWAHDGVALEPCFTYSIGFRAPARGEIAREFLAFLQDRVALDGAYADRGAALQRHAAEIPRKMVRHALEATDSIRWRERDVSRFLGEYLSEPKPHVVFPRPRKPLAPARFASSSSSRGLRLDPRTRMLFRGRDYFVNGERIEADARARAPLTRLADERALPPGAHLSKPLLRLLHPWYLAGWLCIGGEND
jgi:50S ribosomal protein L16 3-hydroxylase